MRTIFHGRPLRVLRDFERRLAGYFDRLSNVSDAMLPCPFNILENCDLCSPENRAASSRVCLVVTTSERADNRHRPVRDADGLGSDVQSRCAKCNLAWRLPSTVALTCTEGSTLLGIEPHVYGSLAAVQHLRVTSPRCHVAFTIRLALSISVCAALSLYNYLYLI
jgi:hypothetical protein